MIWEGEIILNQDIIDKIKYLIFKLNCAIEDQDWCIVVDVRVDLERLLNNDKGE